MSAPTATNERRDEVRLDSNDILRWKRPGRVEDNKAWTVDRSPSGFGFMARIQDEPQIGERIHIRRYDADRWDTVLEPFRVARIEPVTDELLLVGCVMEEEASAATSSSVNAP